MKPLFLTLCLSLSTLAHAEWTIIAKSVTGTFFEMTAENAAVSGSTILVWERATFSDRTSSTSLTRYDCDHIRYKTHEVFVYDLAGNLVNHGAQADPIWESIAPGMVANTLRQVACTVRDVFIRASQPVTPSQPVQRAKRQKYQDM